jgi:hypothetical protein
MDRAGFYLSLEKVSPEHRREKRANAISNRSAEIFSVLFPRISSTPIGGPRSTLGGFSPTSDDIPSVNASDVPVALDPMPRERLRVGQ